jgi:hypothetical protein
MMNSNFIYLLTMANLYTETMSAPIPTPTPDQCKNNGGTWTNNSCNVSLDPWSAYIKADGDYNIQNICHASDSVCVGKMQVTPTTQIMAREFAAKASALPHTPALLTSNLHPTGVCVTNLVLTMPPVGYPSTPCTDIERVVDAIGWAHAIAGGKDSSGNTTYTCPTDAHEYLHMND